MTIIQQLEGLADLFAIDLNYSIIGKVTGTMSFSLAEVPKAKFKVTVAGSKVYGDDQEKDVVVLFRVSGSLYLMAVADAHNYTVFVINTKRLGHTIQKAANSYITFEAYPSLDRLITAYKRGIVKVFMKSIVDTKWKEVSLEDIAC